MLRQEIRHVIDVVTKNAPAVCVCAVLRDLLLGDRHDHWRQRKLTDWVTKWLEPRLE